MGTEPLIVSAVASLLCRYLEGLCFTDGCFSATDEEFARFFKKD